MVNIPKYGEKKDYPKRDIFINGEYVASTTWARTNIQAAREYHKKYKVPFNSITIIKR